MMFFKHHLFGRRLFAATVLLVALAGSAMADETLHRLSENGATLGILYTNGLVDDLQFTVVLDGDVPEATHVWALIGGSQFRQRTHEGQWIEWNGRNEELLDNSFPVVNDRIVFKVIDEDIGEDNRGISIAIGYRLGGVMKYGLFGLLPEGGAIAVSRDETVVGTSEVKHLNGISLDAIRDSFVAYSEASSLVDPIVRLYEVAFGRQVGDSELNSAVTLLSGGTPIETIAQSLTGSQEFIDRFGATTDRSAFVENLYVNGLGRASDAPGKAFWLGSGFTDAQLLLGFSNSDESIVRLSVRCRSSNGC
jgi:hypothetical protein